jgi:hypothetical protein
MNPFIFCAILATFVSSNALSILNDDPIWNCSRTDAIASFFKKTLTVKFDNITSNPYENMTPERAKIINDTINN